jgi:hypothetical protein
MKILIFLTILLTSSQAIASGEVETIFNYADCTVGLSVGAILVKGDQRAQFEGEANRVRQKAYAYIRNQAKGSTKRFDELFKLYAEAVDGKWKVFEAADGNREVMSVFAMDAISLCKRL